MRRIPVDTAPLGEMRFVQSETRTDNEGKVLLRDGVKVQRVSVLVKPRNERPEVIDVNITQDEPIHFGDNEKVWFENLTVMMWQTDGRAGVTYNADHVKSQNAPASSGLPKL